MIIRDFFHRIVQIRDTPGELYGPPPPKVQIQDIPKTVYGPPPPEVQIQDVPKTVYGPPPRDRGMNVVLTNEKTGEKISRWIYDEPLMAGREAQMPLPGDTAVSRQHMLFIRNGKDLYVEDHSKNGTYVNGERLDQARAYRLRQGDSIRVGNTMYIISWGIF